MPFPQFSSYGSQNSYGSPFWAPDIVSPYGSYSNSGPGFGGGRYGFDPYSGPGFDFGPNIGYSGSYGGYPGPNGGYSGSYGGPPGPNGGYPSFGPGYTGGYGMFY